MIQLASVCLKFTKWPLALCRALTGIPIYISWEENAIRVSSFGGKGTPGTVKPGGEKTAGPVCPGINFFNVSIYYLLLLKL